MHVAIVTVSQISSRLGQNPTISIKRCLGIESRASFVAVLLLSVIAGCTAQRLTLPNVSSTTPPKITITALKVGLGASSPDSFISPDNIIGSAFQFNATRYTKLQLAVNAEDPIAGVASLSITISREVNGQAEVLSSTTAHSNVNGLGQTTTFLAILGDDGAGQSGTAKAITLTVADWSYTARIETKNFAGVSNFMNLNFRPYDPLSAEIAVSPKSITRYEHASLIYAVSEGAFFDTTPKVANSPVSVSPSTQTTWTLTATYPAFPLGMIGYPNADGTGEILLPNPAVASATLTVRAGSPPSTGTSGSSPETQAAYTQYFGYTSPANGGFIGYGGTFPKLPILNGKLVGLANVGTRNLYLVKPPATTSDCGSATSTIEVSAPLTGKETFVTDAQLKLLFGSTPITLPVNLVFCTSSNSVTSTPPPLEPVEFVYTYQP